jgi:hypothetical protein
MPAGNRDGTWPSSGLSWICGSWLAPLPGLGLESPGGGENGSSRPAQDERQNDRQAVEVEDMAADDVQREVLPIPDRRPVGLTTYDAKDPDTSFPPIEPLRPPPGAPNVLVVLLDDVGFGAASAFGGPISTPTAERLAAGGLKYNRFHTTALCSPTRAALLSGRNHHTVGMGGVTEIATSAPGYNSLRPKSAAPWPRFSS